MNTYKRHRFPPDIISYAVWLYYRFNLSHWDIENLLLERSVTIIRIAPPQIHILNNPALEGFIIASEIFPRSPKSGNWDGHRQRIRAPDG